MEDESNIGTMRSLAAQLPSNWTLNGPCAHCKTKDEIRTVVEPVSGMSFRYHHVIDGICSDCKEVRKASMESQAEARWRAHRLSRYVESLPPVLQVARLEHLTKGQQELCMEWISGNRGWCFYLHGSTGTGKSYAAAAMSILWAMRKDKTPVFLTLEEIVNERRGAQRDADPIEKYKRMPELLVVDEISEVRSTAVTIETVETIISYRERYLLPTIMTSNLSPARVGEEISPRAMDRIRSGLNRQMSGDSLRGK